MKNKKIPTYIILGLYLVTLITNIILITIYHNNYNTASFINYIILILFSLFFTFHIINTKQERYLLVNVCLICLTFYNVLNLNTQLEKMTTTSKATLSAPPINISYLKSMPDFSNESLTSAVKWAKTNNINITQTYKYSDIIEEQNIIYQNVKAGTTLSKIKDLTLVVSDGADPNKEIVLKDMQGLTIDEVLDEICFEEEGEFMDFVRKHTHYSLGDIDDEIVDEVVAKATDLIGEMSVSYDDTPSL